MLTAGLNRNMSTLGHKNNLASMAYLGILIHRHVELNMVNKSSTLSISKGATHSWQTSREVALTI